jgi:hypothetical protein
MPRSGAYIPEVAVVLLIVGWGVEPGYVVTIIDIL